MTTFKKFVHAKEVINETIGFPKTMNKNYIIRQELVSINEIWTADAATKGGEIDGFLAAAGGAAALMVKAMYNGIIYTKLKTQLPGYLKQYKEFAAPKSEDIYKAKQDRLTQKLKQQKAVLTGSGGSRSENSNTKKEESAKDRIETMFRARIAAADGQGKEALRKQRDAAIEKIDLQIQKLSKEIEEGKNKTEVSWDAAQEKWRQYDEGFKKSQEAFSTAGGILGSAWKNKWEKEFIIAKNEAKTEVLELAKKYATDAKNDSEVAAITASQERAAESSAAAEESLKDIESDADRAERAQADAAQFGIVAYQQAHMQFQESINNAYEKWDKLFEGAELPVETGQDDDSGKKAIEDKIAKLDDKLTKIRTLLDRKKDSTDEKDKDIAERAQRAIDKLESDVAAEKAKLDDTKESVGDLYSMHIRLNEINISLNELASSLLEEENIEPAEGENATFSQLRAIINKVITKAPEDKQQDLASLGAEDVLKIKDAKLEVNSSRNKVVKAIDDNAAKEGDKKLVLPESFGSLASAKAVDATDGTELMDKYVSELKEDYKAEVKPPKNDEDKDVKEPVDDTEPAAEPAAEPEAEPAASTEPSKDDTEVVKKQKERINLTTADIEKFGDVPKDGEGKSKNKAVQGLIDRLKSEKEKLKELQNKDNNSVNTKEKNDEYEDIEDTTPDAPSQALKPVSKFMKFEDYLANKNKKIK